LAGVLVVVGLAGAFGSSGPAAAAPAPEATLVQVTQVTTGYTHACALLSNHQVRCWGSNLYDQLGNGGIYDSRATAVTVLNPTGTGPLTGVAEVRAGGNHTCARLTSGQVRCWGYGLQGQLGDGDTDIEAVPTTVKNPAGTGPLTGVTGLATGGNHTCARVTGNQVRCWGSNSNGQLGNGGGDGQPLPVTVVSTSGSGALTGVTQVVAGGNHACARLGGGEVRCWGYNDKGQLGNGGDDDQAVPQTVLAVTGDGALTGITQLAAGAGHTCGVVGATKQARCWGNGGTYQLGQGEALTVHRPVVVMAATGTGPLANVTQVTAGWDHSCARLASGQVRCWGNNIYGQLGTGNNTFRPRPTAVKATTGSAALGQVTQLSALDQFTCVRLSTGQARCWGIGRSGDLGNGGTGNKNRPVVVRT
jgi:alpha-tubulin suppressor-like RCC1 family protein